MSDEVLEKLATEQAAGDSRAEIRRQALDACLAKLEPRQRSLLARCQQGRHEAG